MRLLGGAGISQPRTVAQILFHAAPSRCSEVQQEGAAGIRLIPPSVPHETAAELARDKVVCDLIKAQLANDRGELGVIRGVQPCLRLRPGSLTVDCWRMQEPPGCDLRSREQQPPYRLCGAG